MLNFDVSAKHAASIIHGTGIYVIVALDDVKIRRLSLTLKE